MPSLWRPPRSRAPVRVRVTAAAAAVAMAGGLLAAVVFVQALDANLESALVDSAHQQAQSIAAQLNQGSPPGQAVVTGRNDVAAQILDARGHVLVSDHRRLTSPMRAFPGVSRGARFRALPDSYVAVARRVPDGRLVVVARSEEQVVRARRTAQLMLAVAVPAGSLVLALAVWVSMGQALRPVEAMRREAATISSAHETRRLPESGTGDEIARLAVTLNEMLDRIDSSHRAQRRFVSDASHELRSPLATMRQVAEVARRHPEHTDVTALADEVLAEEHRMEDLVSALLILARLDEGSAYEPQPVADLDDLVLAEAARLRTDHGPTIDVSAVGPGQVRGHEVLLGQTVHNLVSNAMRHASSRVTLSLVEDAQEVRFTVDDDGDGIPPENRARVFGRFVRLDDTRTRGTGGSGLGLAIVEQVVRTLHGSVAIEDSPTGGARFVVGLPPAN